MLRTDNGSAVELLSFAFNQGLLQIMADGVKLSADLGCYTGMETEPETTKAAAVLDPLAGCLADGDPRLHITCRDAKWIRLDSRMVVTLVAADDPAEGAERFARERGWGGVAAEEVLEMPSVLVGPADRMAEQLVARRERYGFSYLVVSDRSMEEFAPVVSRLGQT